MRQAALLALGVVLLGAVAARAQQQDAYPNGTSGILGGTLPPAPGFYWLAYNYNYHATESVNGAGQPATNAAGQNLDFKFDLFASAHRFIHVTDYKILGADYAWNFVVPFVYIDANIPGGPVSQNAFTVGNLNVEPFVIEWRKPRYDIGMVYGFFAPTARFDQFRPAWAGDGYWTNYVGPAGTYYFDDEKTWSASLLSRYQFNSQQQDTQITPGQVFSFEWGVGKTFRKTFIAGAAGYCSWETTHSHGGADFIPPPLSRSFAAGPEIQYFSPNNKMGFHFRHEFEFDVRNRARGQITTLTFVFAF